MTNAHWLCTLALLTGRQERAVKNCHLVPEEIFAFKHPEKQNWRYSFKGIIETWFRSHLWDENCAALLSFSPQSIRICSFLAEKIICCSPISNGPTLQYYEVKYNKTTKPGPAQTKSVSNLNLITDPYTRLVAVYCSFKDNKFGGSFSVSVAYLISIHIIWINS